MFFKYSEGHLHWQEKSLELIDNEIRELLAKDYSYSGPYYLYNEQIFRSRCAEIQKQLAGSRIYFSCKALSNIHMLKILRDYKNFGIDVVSKGELLRALKAGFPAASIVFAGVGKSEAELAFGLDQDIHAFHAESIFELNSLNTLAKPKGKVARVALRLNPSIEVDTHAHITTGSEKNKFGLSAGDFEQLLGNPSMFSSIEIVGLQAHVGSQLKEVTSYLKTYRFLAEAADQMEKAGFDSIDYLSLGGGFGVDYEHVRKDEEGFRFPFAKLQKELKAINKQDHKLCFEPGRILSAESGCLISSVLGIKEKKGFKYAIIDAGMTDLMRPALYNAAHKILPFKEALDKDFYSIAGPICESTDEFLTAEKFPEVNQGDTICITNTGAYGSVMASNFNSRPFIPELLIQESGGFKVIRRPQTYEEYLELETDIK